MIKEEKSFPTCPRECVQPDCVWLAGHTLGDDQVFADIFFFTNGKPDIRTISTDFFPLTV